MDPTGFAVGVVGLAGLVSTCIEAFQILRSIRAFSRDTELLFVKLDIERELLVQWAQQVGLLKTHHVNRRLFDRRTDVLIYRVLEEIRLLLADAAGMQDKYGERLPAAAVRRREIGHHYAKRRRWEDEDDAKVAKKVSFARKFIWTVHGRDELKGLIDQLGYFIGKLNQMIPSIEQRKASVKELRDAGADIGTLSTLMLAEMRTERDSDNGDWSDLASEVASEAGERVRMRDERKDHRRDDGARRRRRGDDRYEDRRHRSGSTASRSSQHSSKSNGSSASYGSSRSTLLEMMEDMVGRNARPRSTWR